jgi:hypothetical protein
MAANVKLIQDPIYTTTVAVVLREMRDLIDYILDSNAELLGEFAAGNSSYTVVVDALEALRGAAGLISLEKALQGRNGALRLPVARAAGDGPHIIDTSEGNDSSPGKSLRKLHGQ